MKPYRRARMIRPIVPSGSLAVLMVLGAAPAMAQEPDDGRPPIVLEAQAEAGAERPARPPLELYRRAQRIAWAGTGLMLGGLGVALGAIPASSQGELDREWVLFGSGVTLLAPGVLMNAISAHRAGAHLRRAGYDVPRWAGILGLVLSPTGLWGTLFSTIQHIQNRRAFRSGRAIVEI